MAAVSRLEGGDKFGEAMRGVGEKLNSAQSVGVGFFSDATYPNGTSVALVATVQEFGAPSRNIPPRPYFRNMIRDKSPEWPKAIAIQLRETNYDARLTLERVGAAIADQLQNSIATYNAGPPLKPATIARKGFDKQLVDTSRMMDSVGFKVE